MTKNSFQFLACLFSLVLFISSCKEYTPKPAGLNRIDNSKGEIIEYSLSRFSFEYSDQIRIDSLQAPNKEEIWFNIVYPQYNATIYCSYLPMSKTDLPKMLDDSYRLAYSHSVKADAINQRVYSNPERSVHGVVYSIEGNVATPVQFFLTDSVSNFIRGSFYYNEKVNVDSVAPITDFIKNDIEDMISSFVWK